MLWDFHYFRYYMMYLCKFHVVLVYGVHLRDYCIYQYFNLYLHKK